MIPLGLVWIAALIGPPELSEPHTFEGGESGRRGRIVLGDDPAKLFAQNPGCYGLKLGEGGSAEIEGRTLTCTKTPVTMVLPESRGFAPGTVRMQAGQRLDTFSLQRSAQQRTLSLSPAEPRGKPVVKNGSLVIVGGGKMPAEVVKKFIELSGGPDALIVYLPTAGEDPIADVPGEMRMLRTAGAKNVMRLHTRDRSVANDPKFYEAFDKAGGVWFGGGRHWRFIDSYEGTATEKAIRRVLERGGCIGGTSAGASIQADYMPRGHPFGNAIVSAEGYERGLNFLPGVAIDQHFIARKRLGDMAALVTRYPKYLGIGLDEGTAIIIKGSVAEVMGGSEAGFYDNAKGGEIAGDDGVFLKAGEKYDLLVRRRVPSD